MTGDPFGTAAIRERVLAGWSAAAVRLREDANAEEELVLGGYRDRVIVELAQNAADAAAKAGVPGRLLLRLGATDGRPVLVAANTGAALDAAGVLALSTLRASAKRDDDPEALRSAVGRFGVGFAAVLTISDEPAVLSRAGGVRFSAADSRSLVQGLAAAQPDGDLDAELARRDGHVPTLRLPFAAEGTPPDGYDTAVVLPLRDAAAHDVVLRRLAEVDDALLLALPGLAEVMIEVAGEAPRRIADVDSRWRVLRRSGVLDPQLLSDRPVEERRRPVWQVTWAVPRRAAVDPLDLAVADLLGAPEGTYPPSVTVPDAVAAPFVHAPTPTDEPLPWPALLLGTFPLESTRRHVVPGPLTDAIVGHAAAAYADLLAELAEAGQDVLPLVPAGLAAGPLDGALRAAVLPLLAATPLLPSAADPSVLLRPARACVLDLPAGREPDVVAALSVGTPGLVVRRGREAARRTLGVGEVRLADAVEALPLSLGAWSGAGPAEVPGSMPEEPGVGSTRAQALAWHALYQALDVLAADPGAREALAGLPVPLADGRVVTGPRGAVVALGRPGADLASATAVLGVRAVHPAAAHRLLERLGATVATPRALLDLPAVRAAVAAVAAGDLPRGLEGFEDEAAGVAAVVDAVLTLVAGALADGELDPADVTWLGELPLTDADGEPAPACALVLPGSPAERVLEEAEFGPVADELVSRWGAQVLVAAGVRAQLVVTRASGVALEGGPDGAASPGEPEDLDGWQQWAMTTLAACAAAGVDPADAVLDELTAVADLDAVRADAWPQVLAWIACDRQARSALVAPARVLHPRGALDVVGYTAWWLRRELVGGPVADPQAHPVVAQVLPPAPGEVVDLDAAMRAALGCVRRLDELSTDGLVAVLDRLADPALELSPAQLVQAWQHVAVLAEQLAAGVGAGAAAGTVPPAPTHVRVVDGDATVVVPADGVMVVDDPAHLQFYAGGEVIVAAPEHAAGLADLLDLPLSADEVRGVVAEGGDAAGQPVAVPPAAATLLGLADAGQWCEHEQLVVDGVEVDWWVDEAGLVHACTLHGLAQGLAWGQRRWVLRHALAEVLEDPASLPRLLAEGVFG